MASAALQNVAASQSQDDASEERLINEVSYFGGICEFCRISAYVQL
jgi:hypothetical protein